MEINNNIDKYINFKQSNDMKLYYIINDTCIGDTISKGHIWEPWMEKFIKFFYIEGTNMLDIGANIGAITFQQMLKYISPSNKIYCFEPFFGDVIEKTIHENNIKNVIVYKVALSDSNKFLNFPKIDLSSKSNFGGATISSTEVGIHNDYNCFCLDYFNLNNISLIKIDVEGHEIQVLKGMINTMKNSNYPTLLLEIWSFSKGWIYECIVTKQEIGVDIMTRFFETCRLLKELGYIMYHIDQDDFLFVHKNKKEILADFITKSEIL